MQGYVKVLVVFILILIAVGFFAIKSGFANNTFVSKEKKAETEAYCIEKKEVNGKHKIHKASCRHILGEVQTLGQCTGETQAKSKAKYVFTNYVVCKECMKSKFIILK